jgi:hypothetical protein
MSKSPYRSTVASPYREGAGGGGGGGLNFSTQTDNSVANDGTLTITGQGVTKVEFEYAFDSDGSSNSSTTDAVPTMSSDTNPSGQCLYSGSVSAAGLASYGPFDDSTLEWAYLSGVGSVGTGYYGYDFGSGVTKAINKFTMTSRNSYPNQAPKDFKIQYSNDNVTWTDATDGSYTGETGWGATETRTFTFTNGIPYRYWRIFFTDQNGPDASEYYYGLREIELIEAQAGITLDNQDPELGFWGVSDPGGAGNRTITVTNRSGSTQKIKTTFVSE